MGRVAQAIRANRHTYETRKMQLVEELHAALAADIEVLEDDLVHACAGGARSMMLNPERCPRLHAKLQELSGVLDETDAMTSIYKWLVARQWGPGIVIKVFLNSGLLTFAWRH